MRLCVVYVVRRRVDNQSNNYNMRKSAMITECWIKQS